MNFCIMLSNEKDTQMLISEILTNRFSFDLIKAEIRYGDRILQGKGTIYQNRKGRLLIKFFSDNYFSQNERLLYFFEDHNHSNFEGDIISEFGYLEGFDSNERKYRCDRLHLDGHIDNIMEFELLGTLEADFDFGHHTRIIFAAKQEIPVTGNAFVKTEVDQLYWFTDHKDFWKIEINADLNILTTKYEDYIEVLVFEAQNISFSEIHHIIDSLNFVLGIELEPIFINIQDLGHRIYNRKNLFKSQSMFNPPLTRKHSYGDEFTFDNHNRLFCSYYNFICADLKKKLPIIHKRVVSGSRNYVFASALVLSLQIETICKEYFSTFYVPDDKSIKAIESAVEILSQSSLKNKNIPISRLKGMILREGTRNIPVRNILNNLAKSGLITKSLINSWDSLRNVTAHGDNYKDDDEYHPLISDMFLCINLYYQLIFALIGYKGKYSWKEYKKNRLETYPLVENI